MTNYTFFRTTLFAVTLSRKYLDIWNSRFGIDWHSKIKKMSKLLEERATKIHYFNLKRLDKYLLWVPVSRKYLDIWNVKINSRFGIEFGIAKSKGCQNFTTSQPSSKYIKHIFNNICEPTWQWRKSPLNVGNA